MPGLKRGRVLRTPPYRFDLGAAAFPAPGTLLPFTRPVETAGNATGGFGTSAPFLHTAATVRAVDGNILPTGPFENFLDTFTSWYPWYFTFPGYVTRPPRSVVLFATDAFGGTPGLVSVALGPAQAAGASLLCLGAFTIQERSLMTAWAPCSMVNDGIGENPSVNADLIAPETWLAGDVLVIVLADSFYFLPEVFISNTEPFVGNLRSNIIAAEQSLFDRMMLRTARFRGVLMYDNVYTPPDPPPPPPLPPDPETLLSSVGAFSSIVGSRPWAMRQVSGGGFDLTAYSSFIAAEIAAFWG